MINYTDKLIKDILDPPKTIAVVGLSKDKDKPSYLVSKYMLNSGYRIIPVNPNYNEIISLICYKDLISIHERVDIVNIFRKPELVIPTISDAVAIGAKTIWMQLGVINHEAAKTAETAGLTVIMDRCIKIEHTRLF